jgi:pimeloyl-ACP methyl ester carboxylesterase
VTAVRVAVQGIPIACELRGEGRPILLIHGWSADHDYLLADLEPVVRGHPGWRRIYLDLPGHGATPAPEWLWAQDQMLAIVRGLRRTFAGRPEPKGFAEIPVNVSSTAGCARIGWIFRRES